MRRAYFARLWSALRGRRLLTVQIGDRVQVYGPLLMFDGRVTEFSLNHSIDSQAEALIHATSLSAWARDHINP